MSLYAIQYTVQTLYLPSGLMLTLKGHMLPAYRNLEACNTLPLHQTCEHTANTGINTPKLYDITTTTLSRQPVTV